MHARSRGVWHHALAVLSCIVLAPAAFATITPAPASVTIAAGQTSAPINVDVVYPIGGPAAPPSAMLVVTGLPPGVTTNPSPVTLTLLTGIPTASVSFSLVSSPTTPGGTYPLTLTTNPDIGAGIGNLTLIVQTPTFDASITPVPLTLAWGASAPVTVTTIAGGGFSSPVSYSFTGFPSGITTGGSQIVTSPYPPASFTFSVAPRTNPGTYSGMLVATWTAAAPQTRNFPMTVVVQPPTLTATFTPSTLNIVDGGPPAQSSLALTPGMGYTGTPVLAWGALPPGLTVTPSSPSSAPLPPAHSIPVTITARGITPGPHNVAIRVTDAPAGIDVTATLVVTIAPPFDASISVAPPSLSIPGGGNGAVTLTATGINGFAGMLNVNAPTLASITFSPPSFQIRPGESKSVAVQVSGNATPGLSSGMFVATASEITGTRTAQIAINVTPQVPEIVAATPPALTVGTTGTTLRLTGRNFRTGAVVTFTPAGPRITTTAVKSASLAEVVVTIPPATKTGTYRIDLRNPDGGTTAHGLPVIICAASSLGAPLGVSTAAIVYPRPYTAVASGEAVRPRGILATTGLGTIIGTWRLDGIPFEQFAVAASGGLPVEVEAKMPIPASSAGEHRLELVIEQPQRLTTDPVPVIITVESNSGLRIIAPDVAVVAGSERPSIRWSLVPGASGYEVEIDPETNAWPVRVRVSRPEWKPDPRTVTAIGAGAHRYRVAAIFPGEVRGDPTPWRSLTVSTEEHAELGRRASRSRRAALPVFGDIQLASLTIQDSPYPSAEAGTEIIARSSDWQIGLLGTASATDEDVEMTVDAARLQFTGQFEIVDESYELRGTGDVSGRKDLDPNYTAESESRAWQVELGAVQSSFREDFRAGYSPAEFLDQSEFLGAGLARGGGLAKLTTPIGSFSYYDTFLDDAAGAISAYDLSQRVSGAGWEAPADTELGLLRIVGLRARGSGDELGDTTSEALGIFWRKTFSPGLNVLLESAWGSLETATSESTEDVDGYGLHVGIDGMRGTVSYAFNFRSVDSGLANPANLGLTPGAVPDRIGGDLTVGKSFGAKTLSLNLRRLQSGSLADGSGADVTENTSGLNFAMPLGTTAALNLSSMFTTTTGGADPEHYIAGNDRTMVVLGIAVSEFVGTMSMSQSLTWQDLSDDVNPAFDSTVTMGSFTFTGGLAPWLTLNAMLSGSRSESAPPVGTTDFYLATLQPTIQWSGPGIAITPTASFTRIDGELGGRNDTEQYQLIALWSPDWWNSLVNVQVAANWFRNSAEGYPKPDFQKQLAGTLILRWGSSHTSTSQAPPASAALSPSEILRLAEARSHVGAR